MNDTSFRKGFTALARRKPFKPFMVQLVSGGRFAIEQPEALAFSGSVVVYIDKDSETTLFDSSTAIQLADALEGRAPSNS